LIEGEELIKKVDGRSLEFVGAMRWIEVGYRLEGE
jgi:hypothetical protein